jgi:hypothetical protein
VVKVWLHSTTDASPLAVVAPRSNIPDILGRRALPAGRLGRLGATPDFHHGLLDVTCGTTAALHNVPPIAFVRH